MRLANISLSARYVALLDPINTAAPCGKDLEYHPDLLVIQRQIEPIEAAQYGNFIAPNSSINWRDIENTLLKLLGEGRDLRALVPLLRCRIELAGAQGAAEGLTLIARLLECFPHDLHPQHFIDGEEDLLVRSNALGSLVDFGVLDALRAILIDTGSATRLSVRDVEKSFALLRASDALEVEQTQRHLQALRDQRNEVLIALALAHRAALAIAAFSESDLGMETPDFSPLLQLLQPYALAENLLPQAPAALIPRLKAAFARWLNAGESPINEDGIAQETTRLSPSSSMLNPTLSVRRPGSQETPPVLEADVLGETWNTWPATTTATSMPPEAIYPAGAITAQPPNPNDFTHPLSSHRVAPPMSPHSPSHSPMSLMPPASPHNRDDAKRLIQAARSWFETFEPSSPVADLLKQAERLVGKPYVDLMDAIPADLLKAWRSQDVD